MKKVLVFLLLALLLMSLFTGCGSKSDNYAGYSTQANAPMGESGGYYAASKDEYYDSDYYYEEPEAAAADAGYYYDGASDSALVRLAADAGRKLIWRGSMDLETLEYEKSEEALFALVEECGGYIESSTRSGGNVDRFSGTRSMRYAYFSVRIPADKFQYFISAGGTIATVLSTSTGSEDVTDNYFDIEARLTVLRTKEQRLLDMLKKGDELEYLIQIEQELADTRYEIESLTGTLRRYDGLISYSTVSVSLQEVNKPTPIQEPDPITVWDRIAARFMNSLNDIWDTIVEGFVFIIGYSPVLLIAALAVVILVLLVRIPGRKRRKQKKAAAAEAAAENTEK